jgi:hypothetical protein
MGPAIALVGVIAFASGVPIIGIVFTAMALAAAFLNGVFDFCLGCQVYLFIQRTKASAQPGSQS